jgi:ATP-dependent Lon protease
MTYFFDEEEKRQFSRFMIENLKPIQIPNVDLSEIIDARKNFTKDEWIDLLLRST